MEGFTTAQMLARARVAERHARTAIKRDGNSNTNSSKLKKRAFSTSAADYYVPSLPSLPDLASHPTHPLNIYAGSIPSYPGAGKGGGDGATGVDAEIYFMMIKARRAAGKERVIFWFNGGPGCSSFDGSLMEVGPFRTIPAAQTKSKKVELKLVEGGWEEFATIVFIDQPPGTGFSTVPTNGYLHELSQASQHLLKFYEGFYKVFPEYKGVDTYLAGESFAGQYIPYFADAIIKSDVKHFPLKGIAIGNGWIDPREQYQGYIDFGYAKGLLKAGTQEATNAENVMAQCKKETDKWEDGSAMPVNMNSCGGVMGVVTDPFVQDINGKRVCMNVYDTRLVDDWPACGMNWPPDLSDVYDYLRRPDVIQSLHATAKETSWVECDGSVSSQLFLQNTPASVNLLPGILAAQVEIMMFAGDEDLICNYVGIERLLKRLKWDGEQGMGNATVQDWYVNGTYAGTWQKARNMTYVRIAEASHMVGFDVPHVTNDMILRFMGVDMSQVPGVTAMYPSSLGEEAKVMVNLVNSNVEEGHKGKDIDWGSWYHASSAFTIVLLMCAAVGGYYYLRASNRARRARIALESRAPGDGDEEERVPLGGESYELESNGNGYQDLRRGDRHGKGTQKQSEQHRDEEEEEDGPGDVVFDLGEEEEDDERDGKRH